MSQIGRVGMYLLIIATGLASVYTFSSTPFSLVFVIGGQEYMTSSNTASIIFAVTAAVLTVYGYMKKMF